MVRSLPPPRSDRIVFGMVPQGDDDETRSRLQELCACLTRVTGLEVVGHRAPSPEALASAIKTARVQIAWVSPMSYLLSPMMEGAVPLLRTVRQGAPVYHSLLFTRHDAPWREVRELAGCTVGWVSPTSASGYLVPMLSLRRKGLDPKISFKREVFVGSHTAVGRAVLERTVDVGATYGVFRDADPGQPLLKSGFFDADPSARVRILDVSGPVPADLVVASPMLSASHRARLASGMGRLAADAEARPLLDVLMGADSFVAFTPEALLDLEALLRDARAHGLATM